MNIDALIKIITHLTKSIEDDYVNLGVKFFDKNNYHFIASRENYIKQFLEILDKEQIDKDDKIVDAGCGVSPIILMLSILGYTNIHGTDIFQPYLRKLDRLLVTETLLTNIDINDYDYSDCKVVYSFVPIKDEQGITRFYQTVINQLSVNSLLIDYSGTFEDVGIDKYIKTIKDKEFDNIELGVIKRIK